MSQPEHPSADRISDLLAGSLPASEAMSVNAHLSGCAACADLRAELLDVTAVLAEEGAADWPIPADVAAGLDTALAAAATERSGRAGATSESATTPDRSTGSRRRLQWLAGAAAAVVIAGVGFAGVRAISDNGGSTSSSATPGADQSAAGRERSRQNVTAGGVSSGARVIPPAGSAGVGHIVHSLTKAQVPVRARELADHAPTGKSAKTPGCAVPTGGPAVVVEWRGRPAVLTLRTSSRTATIVDCTTGQTPLYVTHY